MVKSGLGKFILESFHVFSRPSTYCESTIQNNQTQLNKIPMFVCFVSFVQKLNLGNHNHGSHRLAKNIRNYRFMKKTTDSGMALNNRCLLNLFQVQVNLFQKHLFLDQLTHNMKKDFSLNYEFSSLLENYKLRTCCEHKLF